MRQVYFTLAPDEIGLVQGATGVEVVVAADLGEDVDEGGLGLGGEDGLEVGGDGA